MIGSISAAHLSPVYESRKARGLLYWTAASNRAYIDLPVV